MKLVKTSENPLSKGARFRLPLTPSTRLDSPLKPVPSQVAKAGDSASSLSSLPSERPDVPAALATEFPFRRPRALRRAPEVQVDQWVYFGTAIMTVFLGLILVLASRN